jgi:hypothetical protein
MWYLSPLACLYDLLQLGFGHRNGFDSSKELPGRESVAPATAALEELGDRTGVEAPLLGAVCDLLSGAGEAGTDEIGLCALESGWA